MLLNSFHILLFPFLAPGLANRKDWELGFAKREAF